MSDEVRKKNSPDKHQVFACSLSGEFLYFNPNRSEYKDRLGLTFILKSENISANIILLSAHFHLIVG